MVHMRRDVVHLKMNSCSGLRFEDVFIMEQFVFKMAGIITLKVVQYLIQYIRSVYVQFVGKLSSVVYVVMIVCVFIWVLSFAKDRGDNRVLSHTALLFY